MRIDFYNIDSVREWLDEVVDPEKYDVYYVGSEKEVVLMKNVSTAPRIHAVIEDVPQPIARELAENYGRPFTTVERLDWVSFKPEFE